MSLAPIDDVLTIHQDGRRELCQVTKEVKVGINGGRGGQHLLVDLVVEVSGKHRLFEHPGKGE